MDHGFQFMMVISLLIFLLKMGWQIIKYEELAVDSKNNYWIALDGSGVQMYNGKEFKQYTMENGLSSDESYTDLCR